MKISFDAKFQVSSTFRKGVIENRIFISIQGNAQ